MKISVITSTLNSEKTLKKTLKSLNAQEYDQIEYIVIDGGSTDNTLEIIEKYGNKVSTLISESDLGVYYALNKGIALSSGDVIGFLHSDDSFADNKTLLNIAKAFSDRNIDAIYGDLNYISKENDSRIIRKWVSGNFDKQKFKNGWMPPHPTFYVRREYYLMLGGFDTNLRISADYDLILRYLWKNNLNVKYIPKVLVNMRLGGISNKNLENIFLKTKEDRLSMLKNNIPSTRALFLKNISKISQFFI